MRVALHSVLREGQDHNYEVAHATVPSDLAESLRVAGIRDWTIWRSGQDLFHLVEADDFVSAMNQLAHDPVNERWQDYMAQFVDHFESVSDDVDGMVLARVWNFGDQLAGEQPGGAESAARP